jgi:tetratricopeptide (TPR) repeat protein/GTPase SAR1 family protein
MPNRTRNQVFICYSHADRRWLKKLQTMLKPLVRNRTITTWADTEIEPGQKWRDKIEGALASAKVAVLLVSDSFLASDFIHKHELPPLLNAAKEEGVTILWVALSDCLHEVTEISEYQAANNPATPLKRLRPSEQDQALKDICEKIRDAFVSQVEDDPLEEAQSNEEQSNEGTLGPDDINVWRLPDRSRELFGRESEFKMLDEAWADPDINIISLVALGGVGKSSLVNHWQRRMGLDGYRGAEKVYAWSFYRQGTSGHGVSADEFIADALHWFGDANSTEGSQWGKGERLTSLIGKQRTLLLLDGLEPLQEPPHSGLQEGQLKEESLRALLRGLATVNPGLCVITSRLPVSDLTDCERYTARRINLEHLSPKAGAELLKAEGVVGAQDELEQASIEFGGHALALTLLGSYLSIVHDGQIIYRSEVDILNQDEENGGHAQRVMASYERWFSGRPELAVLRMISLFDRPAEGAAIAALRKNSDIPDLTEPLKDLSEEQWKRALANLRKAKLIAEKDPAQPDTLDAHPLVREYFKKDLKENYEKAWIQGNDQLFEYFSGEAEEYPETKEEMYILYRAVGHGCQANRHKLAFAKVYYDRIQRRQEFYAPSKLGTVGDDIAALSCFFKVRWNQPVPKITGRWRALLFGQAGYRLWMVGRLNEAITPMSEALNTDKARKVWKYASVDADTLASICLFLGDLTKALSYSEEAVKYARDSGDRDQIVGALSTQGDVLHHQGHLHASQEIFEQAEVLKGDGQQTPAFPHSFGHRRRDLLLSQGRYDEIQNTVRRILNSPDSEAFDLIDSALLYLSLGQATLFQATHKYSEAKANLDLAMEYLRRAGRVVHIPRGRLALADLHLMTGEFSEAKFNLDEALSTATRNHTKLHQADCYLKYAWLYLEQGENEKAQESWSKAEEIIDGWGYHLRDVDSHLLSARLYIAYGEREKAQELWAKAKKVIDQMGYHRRDKDMKDMEEQFKELEPHPR